MVKELEFICANPRYPYYNEITRKHSKLYEELDEVKGIIPYRQNFDGTKSLAVILIKESKREFVLLKAKNLKLTLDQENDVSNNFINRVIREELNFIVKRRRRNKR